jgi:iron complex outermembrane receptor protein
MGRDKERGCRKAKRSDTSSHRHRPAVSGVGGWLVQRRLPEKWVRCAALALLLCLSAPTAGLAQSAPSRDLIKTNLEDLMNMEVTSVSKKEQKLSKAAAAVYVITREDIRRSGATNIPDLLRMAPGVDVARIDSNTWAISIRGFNTRYSNKVLVLVDGRTVYTPVTSGVFWDQLEVPLEDIDRIEVIRGPGGTVWGANAMNGVINIITLNAKATPGSVLSVAGGSEMAQGLVQYGDKIGQKGAYRAYGRFLNVNTSGSPLGGEASDGRHSFQAGFRSDWDLSPQDTMTVQGNLLEMRAHEGVTQVVSSALPLQETVTDGVSAGADNVLGRWNHRLRNGSDMSLQVYYDGFRRLNQGLETSLHTVDLDLDCRLAAGPHNDIVWGLGYRVTSDHFSTGISTSFNPPHLSNSLFSAFIQDEIRLSNFLTLTLGSKIEHNAYTGFEYEPSAQLVWSVTDRQALWLSAARAIRQPSRVDVSLEVDAATFPINGGSSFELLKILGADNPSAEQLRDYEAGYRAQVSKRLSLDVAIFLNFYKHLQTIEPENPSFTSTPAPPHLVLPSDFDYNARASNYGGEIFLTWNATSRWRIVPGYSLLHMKVVRDPVSQDSQVELTPGNSPKHQFQIRSLLNLRRNLDWDSSLSYIGRLDSLGIPSYTRLDTRLAWRIGEFVELSVAGQNLLSPRHREFVDTTGINPTQVERSVFGKITWRF